MKITGDYSIRYDEIQLENYGVFRKQNVFKFDKKRTIFTGGNGMGKTLIVNALAHLGPVPGVVLNREADTNEKMSVNVSVTGHPVLLEKYVRLIFLGGDAVQHLAHDRQQLILEYEIDAGAQDVGVQARIKSKQRDNFEQMLRYKPSKIELYEDMNAESMATGETLCLGYAFVFALREVLSLDIPAVFDSPYGMLDPALKKGAREFFRSQDCQQIYLGSKAEFSDEVADYDLGRL